LKVVHFPEKLASTQHIALFFVEQAFKSKKKYTLKSGNKMKLIVIGPVLEIYYQYLEEAYRGQTLKNRKKSTN
jgi:hypothetical protein